jgi:hypothetical protein
MSAQPALAKKTSTAIEVKSSYIGSTKIQEPVKSSSPSRVLHSQRSGSQMRYSENRVEEDEEVEERNDA